MIYYFSGTGNSEWVARTLAARTHDETAFIPRLLRENVAVEIKAGEVFGLVFPIYAWLAPKVVTEFLGCVKVQKGAYCYAVCTCGDEAGHAMKILNKQMDFDALWSVIMPNNYIVMFDVDSDALARSKVHNAKPRIEEIAGDVNKRKRTTDVYEGSMPGYHSSVVGPMFNKTAMSDKPFYAEDTCTGCGVCASVCPLENIRIKDGRPVWMGRCQKCMSCIHRCPMRAVQHGDTTKRKGRYFFTEELLK